MRPMEGIQIPSKSVKKNSTFSHFLKFLIKKRKGLGKQVLKIIKFKYIFYLFFISFSHIIFKFF